MRRLVLGTTAVVLAAVLAGGCAAGRAFGRGHRAARAGDWDLAVTYYREALQKEPDSARYKIELERAMEAASNKHLVGAREAEAKGDVETALRDYRLASEFAPTNRSAAAKVGELETLIRDRIEASRPRPRIDELKDKARQAAPEPLLSPTSRTPLRLRFNNQNLKDILGFVSSASGINIIFDRDYVDRPFTIDVDGLTLEQALQQLLTANTLFYKVLNERTIVVAADSIQKRAQYEDQIIQTFYISNADVTELQQMLQQLVGQAVGGAANTIRPVIWPGKTANTITVRGTSAVVAIIERIIEANDKPRAELVVDVEILEINRSRAKQYGLNLSNYSLGFNLSPEAAPSTSGTGGQGTSTSGLFNLNTISRGISMADFYLAVPSAVVNFLESDSETKVVAKPQLRGQEGKDLTLNLGDSVPVPSTVYTPIVGGGTGINPLTSFTYKDVGVNVRLKAPRVTYAGDIILDLEVESSNLGSDVNIAGQNLPSFGTRKVTTTLRLRDGESNLLAGLLREDERRSLSGFPGAIHTPVLKQLFSANDNTIAQTDIVMLLTPHIVRTHQLTERDLQPIYIGTGTNPGLGGGPPPLIGQPPSDTEPPASPLAAGAPPATVPGAATPGTPVLPKPPAGAVGALIPGGPTPAAAPGPDRPPAGAVMPPVAAQPPPGPPAPMPSPARPTAPTAPADAAGPSPAQLLVTSPSSELAVGGGPYTVVVSLSGASRVSTVTFTLTFSVANVRVRAVQEGSFMRQGSQQVVFGHQVDSAAGRVDVTLTRSADTVGASGTGTLAAVVFDAAAAGSVTFTVNGVATAPGGAPIVLQGVPATVVVR